jgi:hypothetical protein
MNNPHDDETPVEEYDAQPFEDENIEDGEDA